MENQKAESNSSAPPQDLDEFVPQLCEDSHISFRDLQTAVRVMEAVASLNPGRRNVKDTAQRYEERIEKFKHKNLRHFRKALAKCLDLHKRSMFNGMEEEEFYDQRISQRSLKRQKVAETEMNKKYLQTTALRKGRIEKLRKLQDDAKEEEKLKMITMIPDGHVELNENSTTPLLQNGEQPEQVKLPKLRSCYVCKVRFRDLHHFYDQLCPSCAALNWEKRNQSADLRGKVAVVTGSRVKIGYQTCLKLLRAGCTVVATTRFPNSAAETYRKEKDFDSFKDRLQVYGLDLRDITGIEAFTRFLKIKYSTGIDILINNACQTIRRPVGYYRPLVEREQLLWKEADTVHSSLLAQCSEFEQLRRKLVVNHHASNNRPLESGKPAPKSIMAVDAEDPEVEVLSTLQDETIEEADVPFERTGLTHSAAMSQMVILPEDAGVSDDVLPPGVSDINGQQLDLRHTNSWLLKMEEVSTPEVMECMLINAIAPFVLNSRLKPLMTTPNDDRRPDRYIVNVSAMEGKFYRYKMPNHPHTNMAKASLNMLTRTSAEDLASNHRIYMNSIDTGWINDENPLERASRTAEISNFQTPIDEIDAAARILDPIFTGTNGGKGFSHLYGKFLKDYHESEW